MKHLLIITILSLQAYGQCILGLNPKTKKLECVGGASVSGGAVGGASNLTTVGAVPYVVSAGVLGQAPTGLFYDAPNVRLGVGTGSPLKTLSVDGDIYISGYALLGTTALPSNEFDGMYIVTPQVTDNVGRGIKVEAHFAGAYGSTGIEASVYAEGSGSMDHVNAGQFWSYAPNTATVSNWMAGVYAARTLTGGAVANYMGFYNAGGTGNATNNYAWYNAVDEPSYSKGKFAVSDATLVNATIPYGLYSYKAGPAAGVFGLTTAQIGAFSNSTAAIGAGGAIALGGKSGLASDPYPNAFVFGGRESLANYSGYFAIYTTSGGAGGEINSANYERLRITSLGLVAIGGGGTSSFPALKRSSATLQVRLADDSAFTTIQASNYISNDGSTGITGATCSSFKNGICVAP